MRYLLAVDIGGTKTLFQLSSVQGDVILEQSFISQNYSSFDLALTEFLGQEQTKNITIESACFAVAGPISGRDAIVTNLPWQMNADDLANKFDIAHVHLCNDFEAVAHGIDCLTDDEIITIQQGNLIEDAPRVVIGAGTGLGQAILLPETNAWRVMATEGGHTDFAPTNSLQILLLEHLIERFGHASYERVVSGPGIVIIYEFLRAYKQYDENSELRQAMVNADPGAAISLFANEHQDELAIATMNLFVQIYGAQAGNLALNAIPRAGLYIAGGIAAKNLARFQQSIFIDAFVAKGKMTSLMEQIPIKLILQPRVGLIGARLLAQQSVV